MRTGTLRLLLSFLLLIWALCLSGCPGEEYTYNSDREVMPGPGLFSGEDGAFTIYRKEKKGEEKEAEEQAPES